MKKIFSIIFLFIFVSSLVSCSLVSNFTDEKENANTDNNQNDTIKAEYLYKELECRSFDEYIEYRFSFRNSNYFITLLFPKVWYISEEETSFDIYYGVNKIGCISVDSDYTESGWKTIETHEGGNAPLNSTSYIEYNYDEKGDLIYRHRFDYSFTENSYELKLSIFINYIEADGFTVFKLREGAKITSKEYYTRYHDLKELRDSKILILGNSFISSSQIADILNELFSINNKSCSVNAVSISYATVSKYLDNEEITNEISSKKYDAVFICGLYSEADLTNLNKLIKICNDSDTKLVIFPAHNEKDFLIEDLSFRYPDVYCLNWKNELDMIISSGVSKQELCINDSYSHSNSIAGFVGANMIYRAIYGESPNFDNITTVSKAEINTILYEYLKSEYIIEKIYYFE